MGKHAPCCVRYEPCSWQAALAEWLRCCLHETDPNFIHDDQRFLYLAGFVDTGSPQSCRVSKIVAFLENGQSGGQHMLVLAP